MHTVYIWLRCTGRDSHNLTATTWRAHVVLQHGRARVSGLHWVACSSCAVHVPRVTTVQRCAVICVLCCASTEFESPQMHAADHLMIGNQY